MIKLKQLIKYDNANVLEATWVDVQTETYESPIFERNDEGIEVDTVKTETKTREIETVVKCHAYADVQIDLLRADAEEMDTSLSEYETLITEVETNIVPALPPTEAELKTITDAKRSEDMLKGSTYTLNYTDYQISFTKDDGDGMVQVKNGFDLGLENTIVHFDCGTKMPITSDEFLVFAKWFVTERNKFFIEA